MKRRVGDTLVEVTLAIGIFSMVAIAVVAVMTGGTSSAETALETTLAREEIDTQAEALRFIHSAYIAAVDAGNDDPYVGLWGKIMDRTIDPSNFSDYLTYAPTTCQAVQSSDTLTKYGFVINPRLLSTDPSNAFIQYNSSTFKAATTFPRLIYSSKEASGGDTLIDTTGSTLYRAEGIYVIAVKDNNSTQIVGNTSPSSGSGFYDFYIRTCWYGAGANTPTTISTVIRLYNPPSTTDRYITPTVKINFYANGGSGSMSPITIKAGQSIVIPAPAFTNEGLSWLGWNTAADATGYGYQKNGTIKPAPSGYTYQPNTTYNAPNNLTNYQTLNLYAIWDRFKINYNTNNASGDTVTNVSTSYCDSIDNCYVSNSRPTRSDSHGSFNFKGWSTSKTSTVVSYSPGSKIRPISTSTTLYAVWERYSISYNANGGSYAPVTTYCPTKVGCYLRSEQPSRSGYRFKGWSTSSTATTASYSPGQLFTPSAMSTTLYAVWEARNETITIRADWTSGEDYDSYMKLQKPGDSSFIDANYSTTNINVTYGGSTYSLITGHGDGRGNYNGRYYEQFTINTLGGKNYYYSIRTWPSGYIGNDITITITGQYLGTATFYSRNRNCTGNYWNVFAYKDGVIVNRNTCGPEMEYNY